MNQTPSIFVKLDNGTYVLNDYSNMPDLKDMQCNILYNITQSTQQCSISQAQVAAVTSSANSFNYYPSSSSSSVMSVSISILIQHLTTYNNLIDNYNDKYDNNNYNKGNNHHYNDKNNNINRNNNSFTYQHLNLVEIFSIRCIVAQLISPWTNLVWNLMKVIALQLILLQLATGS